MSNKEDITTIAAEETVVTNYSNNILNHLEDSKKGSKKKCLNQTKKQRNR